LSGSVTFPLGGAGCTYGQVLGTTRAARRRCSSLGDETTEVAHQRANAADPGANRSRYTHTECPIGVPECKILQHR